MTTVSAAVAPNGHERSFVLRRAGRERVLVVIVRAAADVTAGAAGTLRFDAALAAAVLEVPVFVVFGRGAGRGGRGRGDGLVMVKMAVVVAIVVVVIVVVRSMIEDEEADDEDDDADGVG